jgi:hypothetical protein
VSLPRADDLFRPTVERAATAPAEQPAPAGGPTQDAAATQPAEPVTDPAPPKRPSGRVRHDEKMTVYITSEELLEIEHARLSLRRSHGLAVDRGRLVREAVALALADLETRGDDSALVQRLREG